MIELFFPLNPVPASRPKFSKYGTHYGKAHTAYVQEFRALDLDLFSWPSEPLTGLLTVKLIFRVAKPRTSRLVVPHPDIDNLSKLILDCLTDTDRLWNDDRQVAELYALKRFTEPDEEAGTLVTVATYEIQPE